MVHSLLQHCTTSHSHHCSFACSRNLCHLHSSVQVFFCFCFYFLFFFFAISANAIAPFPFLSPPCSSTMSGVRGQIQWHSHACMQEKLCLCSCTALLCCCGLTFASFACALSLSAPPHPLLLAFLLSCSDDGSVAIAAPCVRFAICAPSCIVG